MRSSERSSNETLRAGAIISLVGLFIVLIFYVSVAVQRGHEVGDNNACESLYSGNTTSSSKRAEYDKIADSVDVGAEITWSAQWSYLPPGWTCTAQGKVDGRGTVVGVIHPSEKNTIPVLLGLAIAAGGIATSVYSVIPSVQRARRS